MSLQHRVGSARVGWRRHSWVTGFCLFLVLSQCTEENLNFSLPIAVVEMHLAFAMYRFLFIYFSLILLFFHSIFTTVTRSSFTNAV